MTKYRILKQTYENGKEIFFIQKKFLNLFWVRITDSLCDFIKFNSDYEAKFWIEEQLKEERKNSYKIKQEEIIYP